MLKITVHKIYFSFLSQFSKLFFLFEGSETVLHELSRIFVESESNKKIKSISQSSLIHGHPNMQIIMNI